MCVIHNKRNVIAKLKQKDMKTCHSKLIVESSSKLQQILMFLGSQPMFLQNSQLEASVTSFIVECRMGSQKSGSLENRLCHSYFKCSRPSACSKNAMMITPWQPRLRPCFILTRRECWDNRGAGSLGLKLRSNQR